MTENEDYINFLDWYMVLNNLLAPALSHSNVDARTNAVNLIINFYRLLGHPVRQSVMNLRDIKPVVIDKMMIAFDEWDYNQDGIRD